MREDFKKTVRVGHNKDLMDLKLKNPDFFKNEAGAGEEFLRGVKSALSDVHDLIFADLVEAGMVIRIETQDVIKQLFSCVNEEDNSDGASYFIPPVAGSKKFGGPTIIISADTPLKEIEACMRHEMGHAYDCVLGESDFKSVNSKSFIDAVDQHMYGNKNLDRAPSTTIVFEGDRSFRYEHMPMYGRTHQEVEPNLYTEAAAELFNKFFGIAKMFSIAKSDRYMRLSYREAWDVYKGQIASQIGALIMAENKFERFGLSKQAIYPEDPAYKAANKLGSLNWFASKVNNEHAFLLNAANIGSAELLYVQKALDKLEVPYEISESPIFDDKSALRVRGMENVAVLEACLRLVNEDKVFLSKTSPDLGDSRDCSLMDTLQL